MELKNFIKTVLIDIVEGVEEAKVALKDKAGSIYPLMGAAYTEKFAIKRNNFNGMYYQEAEFDLAVIAENKIDGGAKVGVKVLGIQANVGNDISFNNSTVSRIKFQIPIGLTSRKNKEP